MYDWTDSTLNHCIAVVYRSSIGSQHPYYFLVLHQLVERHNTEKFQEIYDQLPEEYVDLALRWTDLNQQTLLYRCVCVCVCVQVRVHVHMCVLACEYARVCVRVCTCGCVSVFVCMYVCMYVCMHCVN